MEERDETIESGGGRLRAGPLVGGAVLGFAATWFSFALTVLLLYSAFGDTTSPAQTALAVTALVAPPVLAGALMVPRRTRHLGAGLLMGVAIGAIAGAGVCGGYIGLNSL